MARVEVELPPAFVFSTELPVLIGHINHGGHLDNARLLELVSEARARFFASLGYRELDVDGVGIVVADVAVQYLSEAFHGDLLTVSMVVVNLASKGCDLVWQIKTSKLSREVARGKTGIVFFDYGQRQVALAPRGFCEKIAATTGIP